jgi:hypothetical protein
MRRPLNKDDWRAAYREWVYAQELLSAVRQKVLAGRREAQGARETAHRDAQAIGFLEEQVQRKREAMDRCLQDILARQAPRASGLPAQEATVHELVRMTIAVSEPAPGECRWELLALIADGSVITLDQGAECYPTRAAARAAGRRALPPMPER